MTTCRGNSTRQLWGALVALLLCIPACSGTSTTLSDDSVASSVRLTPQAPDESATTPNPTPAFEPTATPESPIADPTPDPDSGGWAEGLTVGDCFNNVGADVEEGEGDGEDVAGPAIDCNGEHEYEIFFLGESSEDTGAAFPTDASFTDGLFDDFCDPATIEFTGASWEVVPVRVTVWTPSETDWAAGDRAFACIAEAALRSENIYKIGTAAGGTLSSDEGIVSRATVGGQRDLYFSFQGSTLYPLTDGDYEFANTTPQVLSSGLLFAAPLQDIVLAGNNAYDYDFASGEVTQLDTGLDGWQIASPHLLLDVPAFLFAARMTEADDWDLYLSAGTDDPVAIAASEGDDQWPALTPDQSQIVYHSEGDIWIMNADGSDQRQLTTDPGGDFESAVSPDGTQVVFASDRSGNDDIWVMNLDGSDQHNLTNHPANDAWPFFSADGDTIYFQTDRLGVQSNIMMMELDGSNQSYYSFEFMTNAALLPDDVATRFAAELPSIAEVVANSIDGIVPGLAGAVAEIGHSSGRLTAALPVGWQFKEVAGVDEVALIAAPSISAFSTSWAADGVLISVVDAVTPVEFETVIDNASAATDDGCVLDDESAETAGNLIRTEHKYHCAENTAVVVGVYDTDIDVGLLFEGQWDRDPSDEADTAFIMAIVDSLQWS